MTLAAFSSQQQEAQHRYIVIEANSGAAAWTPGTGIDDRFSGRYAVNAHVQKTAHTHTEYESHKRQLPRVDVHIEYTAKQIFECLKNKSTRLNGMVEKIKIDIVKVTKCFIIINLSITTACFQPAASLIRAAGPAAKKTVRGGHGRN